MSSIDPPGWLRLPDPSSGNDLQLGRALFDLLQLPDASVLRDMASGKGEGMDTRQPGLQEANLNTALHLASDGYFAAAGAVYILWNIRKAPSWTKHLKGLRAKAARNAKSNAIARRQEDFRRYLDDFSGDKMPLQKTLATIFELSVRTIRRLIKIDREKRGTG